MTVTVRKSATSEPAFTNLSDAEALVAKLDPWPAFAPACVLGGNPNGHRGKVLFRSPDGRYSIGIWECDAAKLVNAYPGTESGHVLKGRARLRDVETGEVQNLKTGDNFFLAFGRTIEWEILETFRKVYTMYETEWDGDRFY